MSRKQIPADGPVGALFAYSSVVRVGNYIAVSGAAPYNDQGQLIGPDQPYEQTKQALANLATALQSVDASMDDVVATRIYVTNISQWRDIGRAHGEAFASIQPAATLVEVRKLLGPGMLVEIEVTAIAPDGR